MSNNMNPIHTTVPTPKNSPSKSTGGSVASESVSLAKQIRELISESTEQGVIDDQDVFYGRLADSGKLIKDLSLLASNANHSVTVAQYTALQQELAQAKLTLAQNADSMKSLNTVTAILKKDLSGAQETLKLTRLEESKKIKHIESEKVQLIEQLANLRAQSTDLAKQMSQARTSKDSESLSELKALKKANADSITRLNNTLQGKNTDIKSEKDKVSRLEKQVVALSAELNIAQNKIDNGEGPSTGPPKTFAEAAISLGSSGVNLVNIAWKSLSAPSRSSLEMAKEGTDSDTKNKLFWINKAVNQSRHSVYKPYKILLGGLLDDVAHMTYNARQAFNPFVNVVLESLSPGGKPLTEAEMLDILNSVEMAKLKLAKPHRKPNVKTFGEFLESQKNGTVSEKGKEAVGSPPKISKSEFRKFNESRQQPLRSVSPSPIEEDDMPPTAEANSEPSTEKKDKPLSAYEKAKLWFKNARLRMRASLKRELTKSNKRLEKYYTLCTGNVFQRIASVPYSWYITWF